MLDVVREMYPDQVAFTSWDDGESYTIDRLLGTDLYRIGQLLDGPGLKAHFLPGVAAFHQAMVPYFMYD